MVAAAGAESGCRRLYEMQHTTVSGPLRREDAVLLVVDVQEAFRDRIPGFDELVAGIAALADGARLLGVPVIVGEQYPRGLGPTVPELDDALEGAPRLEKRTFSLARAGGFADATGAGRAQVLVCGLEAHVCVHQTVADLRAAGHDVLLVLDAVSSQDPLDCEAGIQRMLGDGARASSVEMALFELLGTADDPAFKAISARIKSRAAAREAAGDDELVGHGQAG
jgi:nicotinamidase-related amidase